MDGKQFFGAATKQTQHQGSGYHYGLNNNNNNNSLADQNSIEALFEANKAQSIQFIDSDGCPTDANIMGPLIKMDPSGHRILAPFDAFKFPTSDMVFFKAVVTSCVSECKPALCGSSLQRDRLPPNLFNTAGTTLMELSSTTPQMMPAGELVTTRAGGSDNYQAARSSTTQPPSGLTSVEANMVTDATATTVNHLTSPYAQATTINAQNKLTTLNQTGSSKLPPVQSTTPTPPTTLNERLADLLTTVPGFNVTQRPWLVPTQTQSPAEASDNSIDSAANLAAIVLSNITNNHFSGRPTQPRPSVQPQMLFNNVLDGGGSAADDQLLIKNLNLELLDKQQKSQLINSFAVKFLNQSGLIDQLGLNQLDRRSLNAIAQVLGKPAEISHLADIYSNILTSFKLNKAAGLEVQQQQNGQPIGPASSQRDFEEHKGRPADGSLASQANNRTAPEPKLSLDKFDLNGFIKFLAALERVAGEAIANAATLMNETSQTTNAEQQQQVQSNELNKHPVSAAKEINNSAGFRQADKATRQNKTLPLKSMNLIKSKPALRDKQQAIADSYMGAFHSFGKRRKRRDVSLNNNYAIVTNKQTPSDEHKFTAQATVEMYHLDSDERPRFKRELTDSQRTFYNLDNEMIIQSIKIVDKLQFKDEEDPERQQQAHTSKQQRQQSLPRASLVTGSPSSPRSHSRSTDISQPAQQYLGDLRIDQDDEHQNIAQRLSSFNSKSALGLVLLALIFISIQVMLVLVYFFSFRRNQQSGSVARRRTSNYHRSLIEQTAQLSGTMLSGKSLTSSLSNSYSDDYLQRDPNRRPFQQAIGAACRITGRRDDSINSHLTNNQTVRLPKTICTAAAYSTPNNYL